MVPLSRVTPCHSLITAAYESDKEPLCRAGSVTLVRVEPLSSSRPGASVESRRPRSAPGSPRLGAAGRRCGNELVTRRNDGLVFGSSGAQPFTPTAVRKRALTAWKRAGVDPIGLHECRHTFASLLIAAGVNAKAITAYLGHASIQTTFDLYGNLMPGNEDEAVALVDAYLQ